MKKNTDKRSTWKRIHPNREGLENCMPSVGCFSWLFKKKNKRTDRENEESGEVAKERVTSKIKRFLCPLSIKKRKKNQDWKIEMDNLVKEETEESSIGKEEEKEETEESSLCEDMEIKGMRESSFCDKMEKEEMEKSSLCEECEFSLCPFSSSVYSFLSRLKYFSAGDATSHTLVACSHLASHDLFAESNFRVPVMPQSIFSTEQPFQRNLDASLKLQWLGFPNIGLTCYMNSTLQCLLSLHCFWNTISAHRCSWIRHPKTHMLRCLANLQNVRMLVGNSDDKERYLTDVLECLAARSPTLVEDEEQDAHEFLMVILEQLKEEGQKLTCSVPLYTCPVSIFQFQIRHVRTCQGCGRQSTKVEDFNHLSVNPRPTLMGSLQRYFKSPDGLWYEAVSWWRIGGYDTVCQTPECLDFLCCCGKTILIPEVMEFSSLPRVLILHVMRFNVNGLKIHDSMSIPLELDLSEFCGVTSLDKQNGLSQNTQNSFPNSAQHDTAFEKNSSTRPANRESEEGQGDREKCSDSVNCPPLGTYKLHGVVCHNGYSMDRGHYLSFVARGKGKDWLLFDDDEVQETKEASVLMFAKRKAYLLFYVHSEGEEELSPLNFKENDASRTKVQSKEAQEAPWLFGSM